MRYNNIKTRIKIMIKMQSKLFSKQYNINLLVSYVNYKEILSRM